jgi:histidine triad (HIT) family protein
MAETDADCLFCSIIAGKVPSTKVFEDEHTFAFADISPQAPVHLLIVPKRHLRDIAGLGTEPETAAQLVAAIRAVARQEGITEFRTVFNTGPTAQQTVFHVHAHLLAGRSFNWPPG